ncbi:PucR family transcriptional regulator [Melissospora conviva]|uniref:PucR family transcriptional regulator n=1 Tax=Melissospora conviva TaxID=3388432 RepID=UPI003C19B241
MEKDSLTGPALRRLRDLSGVIVGRICDEVPALRALPDDILQLEIRSVVERSLRLVLGAMGSGAQLRDEELIAPLRQLMFRVRDRPSLPDVVASYLVAARVTWAMLLRVTPPQRRPELLALVEPATRHLQRMLVGVSRAYLDDQQLAQSEVGELRRELAAALLAGEPVGGLPGRAGIAHPAAYLVLAWDAAAPQTTTTAPTRRWRIRAALDGCCDGIVLSMVQERAGTALMPVADGTGEALRAPLRSFVEELATLLGTPARAATALAPDGAAVPAAAAEAREVLDVARRLARPAGLYELDDLLLEVQLSRPSPAADRLAARVQPLLRRADLLLTVRTFIAAGQSRRHAARLLHVHPNTLDYRLRRVAVLTAMDPVDPDGIRLLSAALTVADLRAAT